MNANRTADLRERLGWSQQQMGEFLGVSQTAVWRLESGQEEPGPVARLLTQLEALLAGGRAVIGATPADIVALLLPCQPAEKVA